MVLNSLTEFKTPYMSRLVVESLEDFKQKAENANFEICQHIYNAVKRGIERKSKSVKVFDLVLKGDPMHEYSFTLVRDQWPKALNTCLESYSNQELYEECIIIQKLIKSFDTPTTK